MTDKKESKVDKEIRIQHEYKTKFDNIINKTPMLKKLRDGQQGLQYRGDIVSGVPTESYKEGYEQIDWGKKEDKPKKSFRMKINGRYVDEDESDEQ